MEYYWIQLHWKFSSQVVSQNFPNQWYKVTKNITSLLRFCNFISFKRNLKQNVCNEMNNFSCGYIICNIYVNDIGLPNRPTMGHD